MQYTPTYCGFIQQNLNMKPFIVLGPAPEFFTGDETIAGEGLQN
jgi:hypothetical protein